MNIVYLANVRMPTEKAHGIQIAKMCEAFSNGGAEVTLCASDRDTLKEDPFEYYSVERNFQVAKLKSINLVEWGPLGFLIYTFSFTLSFLKSRFRREADVVYVRDPYLAAILSFFDIAYVWEIHQYFGGYKTLRGFKHAKAVVFISHGLADAYRKRGFVHAQGIVLPDGVDEVQFDVEESKSESRSRFDLPDDIPIVLYTGHLYSWKGVDTLAKAAKHLTDVLVVFVGGTDDDIEAFRNKYGDISSVRIMGRYPYKDMKYFANAADVLVIPNTAKERISREFTSPLKLFNYMASGRPIIASDLPSLREVVDEEFVYFAQPDSPESFAEKIESVLNDAPEAQDKGRRAREEVKKYTWLKRAKEILDILKV